VLNPALYDGATITGSIFLRVPSGSQTVGLYLAGENASGRTYLGAQTMQLTSAWRRFTYTGQVPNGLNRLFLQIGGSETIRSGQVIDIWGSQMELSSTAGPYVMTSALPVVAGKELVNLRPNAQLLSGPSWGFANGSASFNAASAPGGSNAAAILTANSNSGDTYPINGVPNPSLYDGQTVTASVYLRVASGTLNTYLFSENTGDVGFTAPNQPVALTSSWQRFSITATNQNGLSQLALQIGGAETITSGQSLQIWGPQIVVGNSAAPYTPTQN
jgi:hypothetical protein